MNFIQIQRAIVSVTQKDGLIELAKFLHENKVELVSTGGTLTTLTSAGIPVTAVSSVTGFPEILGGRVKTLHPKIHGGILVDKTNIDHVTTLQQLDIQAFDLVCVNLYDFATALTNKLNQYDMIEKIDIGGPCMLRAAAKNFHNVLVLPNVKTYHEAIKELSTHNMKASLAFRRRMAIETFHQTSQYDQLITSYLAGTINLW